MDCKVKEEETVFDEVSERRDKLDECVREDVSVAFPEVVLVSLADKVLFRDFVAESERECVRFLVKVEVAPDFEEDKETVSFAVLDPDSVFVCAVAETDLEDVRVNDWREAETE